jgi:serine/threonine protein phosphatase PrpC
MIIWLSYDHKPKAIVLQSNVGDSQSVASVRGVVEQLSYDHKPKAIVLQSNVGDSQSVATVRGVVERTVNLQHYPVIQ